ncbi:GNAT family N-acetyltransferase [Arthrobacter sp. NPDC092385]|uniref:GNAT family N-acetyltransferase n=1 Tax=Arthrobacter sp. NPDC092385 TaxID=3363943 RepID=UPI00380CA773
MSSRGGESWRYIEFDEASTIEIKVGELVIIRLCVDSDLEDVVELGNQFKKYLGLYPPTAYRESIEKGCVLGAFIDDNLIGYVLFDLPYADIRLIHLCISPEYRKTGVARLLVDEIQRNHSDRQGIRLKCRRDYPAHGVWPKLGFQAESFAEGRGKDKAEMTVWRRSFGHDTLFSSSLASDTRLHVTLDTNVILDLLLGRNQETEDFLNSPILEGEVTYCVSRSVRNELSELRSPDERRQVMLQLGQFEELSAELTVAEALQRELLASISATELSRDLSLNPDSRLVAETIVGGADVMITNDENAAKVLRPLAQRHGVDVLHPSQLVVMIDDLKGLYRDGAGRIQNTELVLDRAPAGSDRELDHLISSHSGETKAQFRTNLRSKASSTLQTVHTAESGLADGLLMTRTTDDTLEVELLRVRPARGGSALLKQLLFQLRHEALRKGMARIVLTDPAPGGGESPAQILEQEGAILIKGRWTMEVVDAQLSVDQLRSPDLSPWQLAPWIDRTIESPEDFAKLERHLWPLKIREAPLRCFVVPIKQTFASELLGYDTPLLTRQKDLGISRRHVYYKSAPYQPSAPGRILWYVSGRGGGSVVAASQLVSSHRGSPSTLHSRFRKYGVWSEVDIKSHARGTGTAVALRFGETEIFRSFVKLSDAEATVKTYGRTLTTMPTVREIPEAAWQEIYSKGMQP